MKDFIIGSKDSEILITTQDLGVIYPNGTIGIHPISLEIFSDQITVLLGPSGAGKSTLLKSLNLLVKPTTGTVEVSGIGMLKKKKDVRDHRRNTGMIFQQHQLIGRLTVLENVLMGRIGHYPAWRSIFSLDKKERQWALECLDRVSLQHKALSRCDALSGGQQQRVGIARAIAQRPNLILADEPIASLDPAASLRVLSMLRLICKQDKIPAIISLHQLEFARQVADRIIGLSEGKVLFDGTPKELNNDVVSQIYGATKTLEPTVPKYPDFSSGGNSQQLH